MKLWEAPSQGEYPPVKISVSSLQSLALSKYLDFILVTAAALGRMTTRKRSRTLNEEHRGFNSSWETAYFVEEVGKNTVCMICSVSIPTKSYNVKRHYETKHMGQYGELTAEQRNTKVDSLKAARQRQRLCLTRPSDDQIRTTEVSYGIAFILAKLGEL